MHSANITVVSMRKDGKGLKAAWDGNEEWMDIPESLRGEFEWKGHYPIGYTTTTKRDGSTGYIIKQVGGKPPESGPAVGRLPNGNGPEHGMLMKMAVELIARGIEPTEALKIMRMGESVVKWFKNPPPEETLKARKPDLEFADDVDDTF